MTTYWADGRVTYGTIEEHRTQRKEELRINASAMIESVYPTWKQINIALGIGGTQDKTPLTSLIKRIQAVVDAKDLEIDAAQTDEELLAIDLTCQ